MPGLTEVKESSMLLAHGVNINWGLIKWTPLYAAFTQTPRRLGGWNDDPPQASIGARRRLGFKLLRAGARIDLSFSQPRDRPWALDFSDHDYAMLKSFDEAGGYVAFEAARVEGAVLVELMDRSCKLPEVLADIVAAFLGLPRGARKKSPE